MLNLDHKYTNDYLINLFKGGYYDNYTKDYKFLLDYQLYEYIYEPVLNHFNFRNPEVFKQSISNLQNEENTIIPKAKKDQLLAKKYHDSMPKNVFHTGRAGTYRYIDMDDIILQSMKLDKLL